MSSSGPGYFTPRQIVFLLCGLLVTIANPCSSSGIQSSLATSDDKDCFLIPTGSTKNIQSPPMKAADTSSHESGTPLRALPQPYLVPLPCASSPCGINTNLTDQTVALTANTHRTVFQDSSKIQTVTYSFHDSAETALDTISVPSAFNSVPQGPEFASRPALPSEPINEPRINALQHLKHSASNSAILSATQPAPTTFSGNSFSDNGWQEKPPQANSFYANSSQSIPSQISADSWKFDIKNQLIESKPENRMASNRLDWNAAIAAARQLESQQKHQDALQMYRSLSQRADVPAIIYHRLAVLMDKTGEVDALPMYHKALAADPNSADIYADLGYRNQLLGDPSNAFYYYKQALAIDPGHSRTHINLGTLVLQVGQSENVAFDHFRKGGLSWVHAKQNVRLITAYQQAQ